MQIEETRQEWNEKKVSQADTLTDRLNKAIDGVYRTIFGRNQLAAKPLPDTILAIQLQCMVTDANMAGLMDALEEMGRINRVDVMLRSVKRFEKMAAEIERPQ